MSIARVAVLVDGDNISPTFASQILARAQSLGRVDIARSYVNGINPSDWLAKPGFQGMHASAGKNSAYILLCIEAMEFALVHSIETFLIATSDSDFSHLAFRLRKIGVQVHGIGEAKAPDRFRSACSTFEMLEKPKAIQNPTPQITSNLVGPLDMKVKKVIRKYGDPKFGIRVSLLGGRMHTDYKTLKSEFTESTWHHYLMKRPALYAVDPRGANAMVKFNPAGFQQN